MEDNVDTRYSKINPYVRKHQSTSTFTDNIYSQCQPLPSTSMDPLPSSFRCVAQRPGATGGSIRLSGQSLSAQVREYYHKYSRGTNLEQYFSLPGSSFEGYAYEWRSKTSNAAASGEPFIATDFEKKTTEISRARRKWDRPGDIIGQSSSIVANTQILHHPIPNQRLTTEIRLSSPEEINKFPGVSESNESQKTKNNSPTSSVASNRPLEWDNGADLGYDNLSCDLPLRDDCSSLLRLDPEGRTCPNIDATSSGGGSAGGSVQISNSHALIPQRTSKPDAHSTQAIGDGTIEINDDIQVTPIIKNHLPGIITGHINTDDIKLPVNDLEMKSSTSYSNTPKSSLSKKSNDSEFSSKAPSNGDIDTDHLLKKSASMNVLAMPFSIVPLTMRSQSEFNLHAFNNVRESGVHHPTNFYSTSSITTIVTKPLTCDKDIQTNISVNIQSKEIQVSEGANDLGGTNSNDNNNNNNNNNNSSSSSSSSSNEHGNFDNNETLKCSKIANGEMSEHEESTSVSPKKLSSVSQKRTVDTQTNSNLEDEDNTEYKSQLRNGSRQSSSEYETDDGGRASNSFEYFPGDIYQNTSRNEDNNGESTSRVSSSMETHLSHSTMPNTSSSFDEKLWGNSDNLLRDLERSLHVLKSLVDANKCDKQVKKRLIHHVIKRLVNAKYTDDKIEHDLADNIPWNPDDTRTKVYRTEIIQALASKQKQRHQNKTENTDEEVEDAQEADQWKLKRIRSSSCGNRTQTNCRDRRKIIDVVMSTENSDIFEERNSDKTDAMQDGRKARMGLRNDERHRHQHHHYHKQQHQQHRGKTVVGNSDKSGSSECFLPQSQGLNYNEVKTINNKPIIKTASPKSQSSSATPNTTSSRDISSQCEIDNQRKQEANGTIDWRLPITISERRFDYDRCASRLGTATRLINYVEMEKQNQLVWINSEINHLSNLKKILEEPKKYENIINKKSLPNKPVLDSDKSSTNSTSTSYDSRTINKQWSSHGNIAERCDKPCNSDIATKQLGKRNNCTQTTTTDGDRKFSSGNTANITPATDNSSCDTSKLRDQACSPTAQSLREPPPWSPRRYCREHGHKRSSCRCQRPSSLSPRRCHDELLDERRPTVSQPAINSRKDAKNLLNDQCKSEFNDVSDYQDDLCCVNRKRRGCCCSKTNESSALSKNNTEESSNDSVQRDKFDELRGRNIEKKMDQSQETKSCRVCGTIYHNDNRKCQCKLTYMKPIAYELSFEEAKRSPILEKKKPYIQPSAATITLASHESCKTSSCSCSSTQPQLKDYLAKNKPEFLDNVEMRKRYMTEIAHLRQLRKEKRRQLLSMAPPNSFVMTQKTIRRAVKSPRKISDDEMKIRLRMRYLRLNEVRNKRRQREKEEQTRRNHLMAKIFCKKLQQKVLEGQVDVSQSISVISNL